MLDLFMIEYLSQNKFCFSFMDILIFACADNHNTGLFYQAAIVGATSLGGVENRMKNVRYIFIYRM